MTDNWSFHQLDSPYLRSAFSFLTSGDDNFDDILVSSVGVFVCAVDLHTKSYCISFSTVTLLLQAETEIEIEDRIAFACKYLPDSKVSSYANLHKLHFVDQANEPNGHQNKSFEKIVFRKSVFMS